MRPGRRSRRIDELRDEDWVREDTAERMRGLYDYRLRRFAARFDDGDGDGATSRSARADLPARCGARCSRPQRAGARCELRDEGDINDEVMRRVERDLDLEDTRLEI